MPTINPHCKIDFPSDTAGSRHLVYAAVALSLLGTPHTVYATAQPLEKTSCLASGNKAVEKSEYWVSTGDFTMGSGKGYSNEAPEHTRQVNGFWIDRFEVTNAMFAKFVEATGYKTTSETAQTVTDSSGDIIEIPPGSAVFFSPTHLTTGHMSDWWAFVEGASWQHPDGPDSTIEGKDDYPVVHVSYLDAKAYANWAERELPSEAEWEFIANRYDYNDKDNSTENKEFKANTWQGNFPLNDEGSDGYSGIAPVASYGKCQQDVYDLIGNVWEWTADEYESSHFGFNANATAVRPESDAKNETFVIKGGSFLCSEDYCFRSRAAARLGNHQFETSNHVGFRTIRRETSE